MQHEPKPQQASLPALKAPLKLKQLSENNRTIISTQKLPKNKIIMQCRPLAIGILSTMRSKICQNCLMEKSVTRCSKCKVIYYCSVQCQKQDWKIHKKQCIVYQKLTQQKKIDPSKILAQFCINTRLYILKMTNRQIAQKIKSMVCLLQNYSPQKLQQFQQITTILIQNIGIDKNQQNFTEMMKQVSIVSLNTFTVQDYLCTYESIGIGLYYPANFINHSCSPNCQQIFDGQCLKIITTKQIDAQQQVSISYVNKLLGYDERQKKVKDGYLFMCFCDKCQVQKMFDWHIFYILCPKCHKQGLQRQNKGKISEKQLRQDGILQEDDEQQQKQSDKNAKNDILCTSCHQFIAIPQISSILQTFQNHLMQFQKPDQQTTYKKLKKQFFNIKKIVSYKNPIFQELLNKVYLNCLAEASQQPKLYEQAYILLKDMIENIPIWYQIIPQEQEIPYFYGWKYAELGKLAYFLSQNGQVKKMKKAAQYTEKAQQIISKIHFEHKFIQVQELNKRAQQMKIQMGIKKTQLFRKN